MKNKTVKQILGMVLVALICFSLLPMSAFATVNDKTSNQDTELEPGWHKDEQEGLRFFVDKDKNVHKSTCSINSPEKDTVKQLTYGFAGNNVGWVLNLDTGVLDIVGSGDMGSEYFLGYPLYTNVTAINVEDGITSIGDNAFSSTYIKNITIPESVTSIGKHAFRDTKLEIINLSSNLTTLGYNAFKDCESLKSIDLPYGLTAIENGTFGACINLTNVSIPNSVTRIGQERETGLEYGAFECCQNLRNITIPDSVTSIGFNAFSYCENLDSFTIPNSVTKVENGALNSCNNLTSLTIGDGLTDLYWLYTGPALKNLTIGKNIKIIDSKFMGNALENVTIPDGVTSIDGYSFNGCKNLTSITIPDSVTRIDIQALRNCPSLTIHGYTGSVAETHAKDLEVPFVSIGNSVNTPPKKTVEVQNPDSAPATTDKPSAWAEIPVNTAITASIVPKDLQGKYTQATTRAEFCALATTLYEKVKGVEIDKHQTFSDTTDINIQKMAGIGVVTGVGNNKFAPNDKLTREQAATMLARLASAIGKPLKEQASTFADNSKISSWATIAVGQVQATEVMSGVGNNTFSPKSDYTREQSIATMLRLYNIVK